MKTKFKRLTKETRYNLLRNVNFRNNQNYILWQKEKYFVLYNYFINKDRKGFIINSIFFSFLISIIILNFLKYDFWIFNILVNIILYILLVWWIIVLIFRIYFIYYKNFIYKNKILLKINNYKFNQMIKNEKNSYNPILKAIDNNFIIK